MIMTIIYIKKKKRTVIFLISSFQITFEQKQKKKSIKIKLLIGHDWLKHLPPVGLRAA